ncbi:phage tail protein [Nocardia tenerifensis]|uniref:phage tail protein n=1 Tax=Nocardia tenerifensis TaxID=228006 RepID=UPI0014745B97|nr:phage tail protein [Nocardia tenerifensis]
MIVDALSGNHFGVELGPFQVARFQHASGLEFSVDVAEVDRAERLVLRGSGEVTLSHPLDVGPAFLKWVTTTAERRDLKIPDVGVAVTTLDKHWGVVRRFELANPWASQWHGPAQPGAGEAAIESVTIVYHTIFVE